MLVKGATDYKKDANYQLHEETHRALRRYVTHYITNIRCPRHSQAFILLLAAKSLWLW